MFSYKLNDLTTWDTPTTLTTSTYISDAQRSIEKAREANVLLAQARRKISFNQDVLCVCEAALKTSIEDSDVRDAVRSIIFNITEQLKTINKESLNQ